MSRLSGPTQRVVDLLQELTRVSPREMTLNELSIALGQNKSTLHSILATLASTDFVIRSDETKGYRLGPGAIPVGRAALGSRAQIVDAAYPEMRRLSSKFDAHCVVTAEVNGRVGVLSASGTPSRVTNHFHEGQLEHPLVPPLGATYVAWSDSEKIESWLDRASPALDQVERTFYIRILEETRQRGYCVASRLDASTRLERAFEQSHAGIADPSELRDAMNQVLLDMRTDYYILSDLEDVVTNEVDWISAPLFASDGRFEAALIMTNFPEPLNGRQIAHIAEEMRQTAARVSALVRGAAD